MKFLDLLNLVSTHSLKSHETDVKKKGCTWLYVTHDPFQTADVVRHLTKVIFIDYLFQVYKHGTYEFVFERQNL